VANPVPLCMFLLKRMRGRVQRDAVSLWRVGPPRGSGKCTKGGEKKSYPGFPPAGGGLDSPVLSAAAERLDPMLSRSSCPFASSPEPCHLFRLKALWEQELSLPVCLHSPKATGS